MEWLKKIINFNKQEIKSNKQTCFYCGNELSGSQRHFCSHTCNSKYWFGVYRKKWREGAFDVAVYDKPTKKDIKKDKQKYNARRLAYKKIKKGITICQLCGEEIRKSNIVRHHEDYSKPEIIMVICTKCHGFIKRYTNLKKKLFSIEMKGGYRNNGNK